MRWLLDAAYLLALTVTAPLWLWRLVRSGKVRTDWSARFGRVKIAAAARRPRVLLHAVSVGEINAIRQLVDRLAQAAAAPELVISVTTNTGFARAAALFGQRHPVVRYPLDFSFAVERFLSAVQPQAVALVELEVWPNFIAACARRHIPVCVVNGRLSPRSFRRYRLVRPLVRTSFRSLSFVAAQTEAYAERFRCLGADPASVRMTGTMKWDAAGIEPDEAGAARLAEEMGIDRGRPLVVGGSTAPGEHELLASAVPPGVQLLCAPRRPEWFDQAAAALPGCARRSRRERGSATGRFLLDTIGELQQAYALADVVVIGRSFARLHGSDMMEPVGMGKPTIVGPFVGDFRDTVDALLAAGGLLQVEEGQLPSALDRLLADPQRRRALSENARRAISARQGATERHAEMILALLQGGVQPEKRSP